jgi:hypothetical protein
VDLRYAFWGVAATQRSTHALPFAAVDLRYAFWGVAAGGKAAFVVGALAPR